MYRKTYMDADYRRDPKTNLYCIMCQRDLKPGQPHRMVCHELDRYDAIHADDWEVAAKEISGRRAKHLDAVCYQPIGMDCAKRLGLEFSRPA